MSRSVASPDAETPSYWPVFISWTISSEVFPILLLTWQPVACSNGWTQSTFGSLLPSSAYPAQLTRFNCPSPCPRLCCMATLGSAGVPPAALPPPPPPPPQAASVSAARTATTAARLRPMRYIPSPPYRRRSAERVHGLRPPGQPHAVPATGPGMRRSAGVGGAGDDEDRADIQDDHVADLRARVHDVGHGAGRAPLLGGVTGVAVLGHQPDPLRAEADRALGPEEAQGRIALHDVGRPDEVGDEGIARPLVDLRRRSDLLDRPRVEDDDPVAHGEGLVLVVGDQEEGDADLPLQALELHLHLFAQLAVQRGQRLVQQQHLWTVHQGAGEGDPLPLTARELGRLARPVVRQPHGLQRLGHPAPTFRLARPADQESVPHVLLHGHVREQRVVLEDGVDLAVERRDVGHVTAGQPHAALGGALEAGDHPQAGCLAGAGGAQQRQELAWQDVQ